MKLLLVLLLYPGLIPVCVRYVDDDGFLRGREILFNQHGKDMTLSTYPFAVEGSCPAGEQGPTTRVKVCLVMSSPCHHDRSTNVWGDQVEQYFDRYPGSYRGKCTSECSSHPDDCLSRAAVGGVHDWREWMGWMRAMCSERINGCN